MKAKSKKPVKKVKKTKAATKKASKKKKVAKKVAQKTAKKAVKKSTKKGGKKSVKAIKKIITTTTTTTVTTTTASVAPTETHYLLILDESGSMFGVRQNTLNGVNEQIQTIKNLDKKYPDQKYSISIVKFSNDDVSPLIENVPASQVKELSPEDYVPNGGTPLYDAIGISVTNLKNKIQSKLNTGEASALVVILTDGAENQSSVEKWKDADFSDQGKKIRNLITELSKSNLWTFTFIGANQDAVLTATKLGVSANNVANYTASNQGSTLAFSALNSSLGKRAMYRSAGVFTNDSYLGEVTCNNNIGEDALSLDLSGTVSDEDIQKAKDALKNSIDPTNTTTK
jgi:uncharacterized protein YegL